MISHILGHGSWLAHLSLRRYRSRTTTQSVECFKQRSLSSASLVIAAGCRDRQKFSICHTFLGPPASAMASNRPFGDGIAPQASGLLELNRTEALPSSVTCSNALSRSKLCQETSRLFPSADQPAPINPFHPFTTTSRVLPVDVERKWIFPS